MAHQPVCLVPSVLGVSEMSTAVLENASPDVMVFTLRRRGPFSVRRFNLEALDVQWVKPPQPIDDDVRIETLGPSPERELRMLRMFHEVGREFLAGATSLREIARVLEDRDLRGDHPDSLPYTLASVSRECRYARESFGKRFQLEGDVDLFVSQGHGFAISGLSELGVVAWEMTRDFLVRQQIISADT
ncbi:hypothetical protein K2Y11_09605 [bacterium]|nr:hypothetical protein [bacterium]